ATSGRTTSWARTSRQRRRRGRPHGSSARSGSASAASTTSASTGPRRLRPSRCRRAWRRSGSSASASRRGPPTPSTSTTAAAAAAASTSARPRRLARRACASASASSSAATASFGGDGTLGFAGVPLGEVGGGVDLLTAFEVAAFRTFALAYHFRRHYGDQALSDFSLRLAFHPRFVDGLSVALAIERQGLRSWFSLFRDLEDQNALVFDVEYPLTGAAHLSIRSRYGYRRLADAEDGTERFLVQRRFEPFVGLRYRF